MGNRAEKANQMMSYVWELNTLVNGTHEGRCLAHHFKERGEEFLTWLQSVELEEDQKDFLKYEFELAVPRLAQEVDTLQKILDMLEKARQIVQ